MVRNSPFLFMRHWTFQDYLVQNVYIHNETINRCNRKKKKKTAVILGDNFFFFSHGFNNRNDRVMVEFYLLIL